MTTARQSRIRWLLLFSIFVMGAITYLDRVNISISGHWLAEEYHFTNPQLGLIFGAFPLGDALFQVPAGWTCGPLRLTTGADRRGSVVGSLYSAHCAGSVRYPRRSALLSGRTLRSRSRRGGDLSQLESLRCELDSRE